MPSQVPDRLFGILRSRTFSKSLYTVRSSLSPSEHFVCWPAVRDGSRIAYHVTQWDGSQAQVSGMGGSSPRSCFAVPSDEVAGTASFVFHGVALSRAPPDRDRTSFYGDRDQPASPSREMEVLDCVAAEGL